MMKLAPISALVLLVACAPAKFIEKGIHDGVEVAYRWNHPVDKPSELLLRLKNTTAGDKHLDLVLDLSYQGLTVESFEADTCIRAGQTMNGKLNGIYFVPQRLTTAQIKDGGADLDMTRTLIEPATCP
ncbi:MAG: hypothetical protein ABI432_01605 [Flavobacteriales bacterium]